jgi:hypothetical protein
MAKLEAMKPTGPVDPDYARGWVQPEPVFPKELPKWEDDESNKAHQKSPDQLKYERMMEKLQFWPYRQTVPRGLVTLVSPQSLVASQDLRINRSQAPFLLNNLRDTTKPGQPFALPEVKQTCLLFEMLLPNDVVRQKITELLFENHDTAWKFAATSRESWRYITYDTVSFLMAKKR